MAHETKADCGDCRPQHATRGRMEHARGHDHGKAWPDRKRERARADRANRKRAQEPCRAYRVDERPPGHLAAERHQPARSKDQADIELRPPQIFCSVVTDLLQPGGGLFLMRTASLKSAVVKRSIVVSGHKTSVSLEDAFWKGLKEIAGGRHLSLSDLIARIDSDREYGNLSSAIRLFVLDFYREQLSRLALANDEGHGQAGTQTRPFA